MTTSEGSRVAMVMQVCCFLGAGLMLLMAAIFNLHLVSLTCGKVAWLYRDMGIPGIVLGSTVYGWELPVPLICIPILVFLMFRAFASAVYVLDAERESFRKISAHCICWVFPFGTAVWVYSLCRRAR